MSLLRAFRFVTPKREVPMIVDKEFKKLFDDIAVNEAGVITLSGMPISVRVFDHGTKLFLGVLIYQNSNYIPKSVRKCLEDKPPFHAPHLKTIFKIDEEHFQISLNYLGHLEHFNQRKFIDLIEDFSELAGQWRHYLDDNDKKDLIHVRQPK